MQQHWTVDEPWLDLRCSLAEGPFYEKATNSVRFVDIKRNSIHTVSVIEGQPSLQTCQLDICPTVTADIEGVDPRERILVGVKYGLAVLDRRSGRYEMLARFNNLDNERLRSNDGAADPHGRFWIGSMTDFGYGEFRPEGSLYRFGQDSKEEVVKGLTIPNSIGWSPDNNKTMYYTHSKARQIFALDYDPSSGVVSNQRLFYQHPTAGEPDGFRIDVDGNLWTAVYGEAKVLRINPQGEVTGQISLPTRNITCVQFVGTELVITSAADEGGEGQSKLYGGGLFRVDVGTTGLDLFKFKM
ncbi:rRNA-processing protein cgr1 [Conoideocrella luteorostrata]|uniref:rRNA-processing protein cgr1 n=1 Tax=Conoideocrella luteorostrata TaxID=1105319 RepID=A0AAJ0FSU6_9HYPO|nr:rRNA-processing protein cgr1 [Conoideocrella luteorostrata]